MYRRTLLGSVAAALAVPALAQKSSVLRFVPQSNLTALDPIWTTATVTGNHGYYVYDTLYSADSKLAPQPQMAEGQEVSDDGRSWRFRLREGLRFHDGTPVRGADCIASIKRWAAREPIGQLLAQVADSYVPVDDRTFEIRLTRPFPLMLDALAKPDSSIPFIMPERIAATDPNKQFTEVVGSGPYRFLPDEYVSGSRVVYAKFDGYVPRREKPDWATGAKVAGFDRIEWQIIPDPATAAAALERGEVDWWERPLNDLLPSLAASNGVSTFIQDVGGRMALMRLNHLQPPFNDVRIRRAVLMSVDQDEYLRATYGDDTSLWSVCRSIYPCSTPYASETEAKTVMRGDLDAARRMLKEAGYAGQKVVIISPSDYPQIGPLGQVTADRLRPDRHERRSPGDGLGLRGAAPDLARAGGERRVEHLPYHRLVAGLLQPGRLRAGARAGGEGLVWLVGQPEGRGDGRGVDQRAGRRDAPPPGRGDRQPGVGRGGHDPARHVLHQDRVPG